MAQSIHSGAMMMSVDDKHGLRDEDLTLIGGFYCSGWRPVFVGNDDGCEVTAGPIPYLAFVILEVVILSFFVAIGTLVYVKNPQAITPMAVAIYVVAGLLAIIGPIVAHGLQFRQMRTNSPLLRFDVRTQMVSILNGQKAFPKHQVYCLLFITMPVGHEANGAEVQLIVDTPEGRTRHFIDSALSSTTTIFRKAYLPFAKMTGLRLLNAKQKTKLLGLHLGDLVVTEEVEGVDDAQFTSR
jgi:hypothetical protein